MICTTSNLWMLPRTACLVHSFMSAVPSGIGPIVCRCMTWSPSSLQEGEGFRSCVHCHIVFAPCFSRLHSQTPMPVARQHAIRVPGRPVPVPNHGRVPGWRLALSAHAIQGEAVLGASCSVVCCIHRSMLGLHASPARVASGY